MSEKLSSDNLSRRDALRILAGSVGAAASSSSLRGAAVYGAHTHGLEASATPLSFPYAAKFFNPKQMLSIEAISEIIIPEDAHSPGATAARVNEYIDEIISASSDEQKALWEAGLIAMDKMAQLDQGREFRDCTQERQRDFMERISKHEDRPTTIEERFFVAAKKATIDGYYTSRIGIHQELEYQGNTAQLDFEGCKTWRI